MSSFIGLKVSEIKHRDVFICGGCNLILTLPDNIKPNILLKYPNCLKIFDGNTINKRRGIWFILLKNIIISLYIN